MWFFTQKSHLSYIEETWVEESQLEGTLRVAKLILGSFLLLLVSISGDMDPDQNFPRTQEALEHCRQHVQPMLLFMYLSGKGEWSFPQSISLQTVFSIHLCDQNRPPIKTVCDKYQTSIYLRLHHDGLISSQFPQNLAIAEPPLQADH